MNPLESLVGPFDAGDDGVLSLKCRVAPTQAEQGTARVAKWHRAWQAGCVMVLAANVWGGLPAPVSSVVPRLAITAR